MNFELNITEKYKDETFIDEYEHYEIDFEEGWQGRLLNEMIEVALMYRKFESQATE